MLDWRADVVAAVDVWLASETGGRRPGDQRWRRVGEANPAGSDGWYVVDIRDDRSPADQLDRLQLGADEPPGKVRGYAVVEAVTEGTLLRVRAGSHVPAAARVLWAQVPAPGYLIKSLRDRLARLDNPGIADALARRRFSPLPGPLNDRVLPGDWRDGQRRALAACGSAGLYLVWGPPGTGKTRVLARAIGDALRDGRRVLLVSGTNAAVDNALEMVLRERPGRTGELLRVGPPSTGAIAGNADVALGQVIAQRCRDAAQEVVSLEARLVALRERVDELQRLNVALLGYDPAGYQRAVDRLAREADVAAARRRLAALEVALADDRAAYERAGSTMSAAMVAIERVAPARTLLDAADERQAALDGLNVAIALAAARRRASSAVLAKAEDDLADHLRQPSHRRVGRLGRRRELATIRDNAAGEERAAQEAEAVARQDAEHQRAALTRMINDLRRHADPVGRESITNADAVLAAARAELSRASTVIGAARVRRDQARAAANLLAADAPTADDRRLVEETQRAGLPEMHARVRRLREVVGAEEAARRDVEGQIRAAEDKLERLRRDAEAEVIGQARLVATTLARLRLHPALEKARFDVVLVDEVGACTVPEVLVALSAATRTAVLLGDFLQLGPIVRLDGRGAAGNAPASPSVERWLRSDVFAFAGITTAADARAHPSCAVLDEQFRFGNLVMELANRGAYGGVLRAGARRPPRPRSDPEVILVDTDDLGDLGRVRRDRAYAGWWPAGALLARVLAELHADRGESVGVVTPFRDQAEAALAVLREAEAGQAHGRAGPPVGSLLADVGTAHRFQGREFDVVLFDLVLEEALPRWIDRASLSAQGWDRDNARLSNVAMTRSRHRLYLIGSGRALAGVRPGTAFRPTSELLAASQITVVPATSLLTPATRPAEEDIPLVSELAEVLARHIEVVDIEDERSFYPALKTRLADANASVWMWAPWLMTRLNEVGPWLVDARERGVQVTVFTRDSGDGLQGRQGGGDRIRHLRAAGITCVPIKDMHQKIIVIDDSISMVGSLNALSHGTRASAATRDIMLVHAGRHFARRLLDAEYAEPLSRLRSCEKCGNDESVRAQLLRSAKSKGWHWTCRNCSWRTPIPGTTPGKRSALS